MKTLLKTIALVSTTLVFTSVAFAGSTNESTSIPTVKVTDAGLSSTSWGSSVTISPGEKLAVQLHYYLLSGDSTSDMRFSMEDLTDRVFSAGTSETVTGSVKGTGLTTSNGSATVHFTDNVELNLYNVSWQKGGCSSVGCEETLVDSYNKVLTSGGMSIGSVDGYTGNNWQGTHYNGNVIVEFKAVAASVSTYDDCTLDGVTVAHGDSHRFYSARTTTGQCSAIDLVRTCNDGVLSGSNTYRYATCTTETADVDANVTTLTATNIARNTATIRGSLDVNDWGTTQVYFKWGTSSNSLPNTTAAVDRSTDGNFARGLTGLSANTTYYYRAVIKDVSTGEVKQGSVRSFTTNSNPVTYDDCTLDGVTVAHGDSHRFYSARTTTGQCSAIDLVRTCNDGVLSGSNTYRYATCTTEVNDDEDVTTRSATNIDEDSARLNGDWDGDNNTDVWFAFDKNDSTPSCLDSSQRVGRTTVDDGDDFSEVVSGLDENTTYYFRACAEDRDGDVISGSIRNFTTDEEDDGNNSDDVDVTTRSATNIDEDSARLNGEMDGDDNVDVWFAFSRTDSTPSCNASSQEVGKTNVDDGDDFSETVTGLQSNTTYYFRACAEDNDGSVVSGSIREFTTDEDDDNTTPAELDAITNIASGITTSSARLNSIVLGEGNATCYFQYGRTSSFGLTSPRVSVDLDDTSSCSSLRTGLASDSTYYYRAVIEQNGNTEYGSTRTFRTNRVVTTTPNNPTVTNTNTRITIVNQSNGGSDDLDVTKWVSAETDPRFDTFTDAAPGETVYYKVRVENNTGEDLDDIVVIDRIPFYLELDEDRGTDDDDDKQVRWVIDLEDGESRTFVTEMRVREDARDGDVIISYASAEAEDYSANSNDVEIEVEEDFDFGDEEDDNAGQAGFLFGAGIFPNDVTGWALLILIILAIAYFISRIMAARDERSRILAELAAAKAARNQG